ncbi:hypothetical protein M3589_23660 [Heyndrickxia oleronia]|uniref:hypothetical protein n=1 Tax=Heyndrickxia oleronia TaxID=38875 RepID=UPI00203BDC29|nr:hypothetical protein [Heyndrickxia oleronia]MCM3240655.1 hypothetical protein [Heyndrickxia oleronia]
MEYIRHIPVEAWNLVEQDSQLEESLKNLELSKISLIKSLRQFRNWEDLSKETPKINNKSNIEVQDNEDYVKIIIPGILPYVQLNHKLKDKNYYRQLNMFYVGEITRKITEQDISKEFKQAFVLIKQFFPDLKIRDFDNQFKSFIFNALRYSRLIPDDSWGNLTYMECGELDRITPRTEITITNLHKLGDFFSVFD